MDPNRKAWNERLKDLRQALEKTGDKEKATELFSIQHGMVHSSKLSNKKLYSFEDEALESLSADTFRVIPDGMNHSIAWLLWHLARIEDVTMNILIADSSQLLHKDCWYTKLKVEAINTGNGMSNDDVRQLSEQIDIKALRGYRLAVAKQTEKIVKKLQPTDYRSNVDPRRIQRIWDEKAMLPGGKAIANYWSKRTVAGLLLMPPTRHCLLHLNEAIRIRMKFKL